MFIIEERFSDDDFTSTTRRKVWNEEYKYASLPYYYFFSIKSRRINAIPWPVHTVGGNRNKGIESKTRHECISFVTLINEMKPKRRKAYMYNILYPLEIPVNGRHTHTHTYSHSHTHSVCMYAI